MPVTTELMLHQSPPRTPCGPRFSSSVNVMSVTCLNRICVGSIGAVLLIGTGKDAMLRVECAAALLGAAAADSNAAAEEGAVVRAIVLGSATPW